jgi:endoglucanase
MKTKFLSYLAAAGISTAFGATAIQADVAMTPVQQYGALSVNGNKIVGSAGKPVMLSGVSHFWSNTGWGQEGFYNQKAFSYFAYDWNASLFRVAVGGHESGGYLEDPAGNLKRAEVIIDAAIEGGRYVIIDWHSHHAEDNQEVAIKFFKKMAKKYGKTPNVIYEIYNEPLNTASWEQNVKPYAEAVIAAIRAEDPDNLIIVGSPNWSQDADVAANDPIKGYANIAYTLHFYAGTHKQELRNKTQIALDKGLAIFATEWGTINANGDGAVAAEETQLWLDFLNANCISNANWSVSNKAEGASIFKPGTSQTGPWTNDDLTESGALVRNHVRGGTRICK